ncbi:MAG TPA: hypothetical protein VE753_06585 [Gaiellaceae bacterium]|nr:hypothetical protein [Gaiellaceae bacterium]
MPAGVVGADELAVLAREGVDDAFDAQEVEAKEYESSVKSDARQLSPPSLVLKSPPRSSARSPTRRSGRKSRPLA